MATSSAAADIPPPQTAVDSFTVADLHALTTDNSKVAGRDYLVVDVRRTDIDVSAARGFDRQSHYYCRQILTD